MRKAGHVADLGNEHCGVDPADAVELLDHPIPGVVTEPAMDPTVEFGDLTVIHLDQIPQRVISSVTDVAGVTRGAGAGDEGSWNGPWTRISPTIWIAWNP